MPYEEGEEGPKKPSPTLESLLPAQSSVATLDDDDETYQPSCHTEQPKTVEKRVLDNVVRKLSLSQRQAETLPCENK